MLLQVSGIADALACTSLKPDYNCSPRVSDHQFQYVPSWYVRHFPLFLHPTFFFKTVLMGAVWGAAVCSLFWWQSMLVASPLKKIYIILNSRFLFSTCFLLENATAAMFCILKDSIYRKVVARQHVWDWWNQTLSYFRMKLYKKFRQCLPNMFKTYLKLTMGPPFFKQMN